MDETQRTIQGLVTPHRYPPGRSISPRIAANVSDNFPSSPVPDSSDNILNDTLADSSDSYSNNSYASAVGSQEDFTLIDLHMQVNRLIVDSPMLMSSYVTHLTQAKCTNWDSARQNDQFNQPLFEKNSEDKLVYTGMYEEICHLKLGLNAIKSLN